MEPLKNTRDNDTQALTEPRESLLDKVLGTEHHKQFVVPPPLPAPVNHEGIPGKLSSSLGVDREKHLVDPAPPKHESIFDRFTGHEIAGPPPPALPQVAKHGGILERVHEGPAVVPPPLIEGVLEKLGLEHHSAPLLPPPPPVIPQHHGVVDKLGHGHHDAPSLVAESTVPQHESVLEKLGLERHPPTPTPPVIPPAPKHEGLLEKLGLEHHTVPVPPSAPVVPQHKSLLEKIGTEYHHVVPPPALSAPPKHEGVLEKLLDHHTAAPSPSGPAAREGEGILEKIGLGHEHHAPPPVPPKHKGMLDKIRDEHGQSPHPYESGLLENIKAGWVTPPAPPTPPHEGLLEKIGLVQQPPPLAPKPAGIMANNHDHHDVKSPPTERLTDKISVLGHGVLHGRETPPKEEQGLTHKLGGVFHEEKNESDEGGVPGLVRKVSGALRGEKEEGIINKAAEFVHEHVHPDETTSEKIADLVKREYRKVEHGLRDFYE